MRTRRNKPAYQRQWTDEEVKRVILDQRWRAAYARLGMPYPDPPCQRSSTADQFERWLLRRWLAHIRSGAEAGKIAKLRAAFEAEQHSTVE